MDPNVIIAGLGILGSVLAGLWKVYTSLGFKIDGITVKMESNKEEILDKLIYHERHDDQRFTDVNNALWALRVDYAQNQRGQGQIPPIPPNQIRNHGRTEIPAGTV